MKINLKLRSDISNEILDLQSLSLKQTLVKKAIKNVEKVGKGEKNIFKFFFILKKLCLFAKFHSDSLKNEDRITKCIQIGLFHPPLCQNSIENNYIFNNTKMHTPLSLNRRLIKISTTVALK